MKQYANKAKDFFQSRLFSLIVLIVASILGIASRKWGSSLPLFLANYTGDTMWALAAFAIFRGVFPTLKLHTVFILALDFSFIIELSQLWHNAFLDAIRQTIIGGLVLGFGFKWTDLICYACGCLIGWIIFSLTLRQVSFSS